MLFVITLGCGVWCGCTLSGELWFQVPVVVTESESGWVCVKGSWFCIMCERVAFDSLCVGVVRDLL